MNVQNFLYLLADIMRCSSYWPQEKSVCFLLIPQLCMIASSLLNENHCGFITVGCFQGRVYGKPIAHAHCEAPCQKNAGSGRWKMDMFCHSSWSNVMASKEEQILKLQALSNEPLPCTSKSMLGCISSLRAESFPFYWWGSNLSCYMFLFTPCIIHYNRMEGSIQYLE